MKKNVLIVLAAIVLFSFKIIDNTTWTLDKAHAKLGFTINHLMVSEVEGWFKIFDAKITASKEDFSDAKVEMTAAANSINTDNEMRDKDLKSAKYFDVEKYPNITFRSKVFKKVDTNNYKVIGDLTIHGITKAVELNALCKTGIHPMTKKTIAGFKITGVIKRSDFGIGASTPASIMGEDVSLIANVEFTED